MGKLEQINMKTERKERKKSGDESPPVGGSDLWRRSPPSSNHSSLPRDSIMTLLSPARAEPVAPYNTGRPPHQLSNLRQFHKSSNEKAKST
jgi:hypothetical protein